MTFNAFLYTMNCLSRVHLFGFFFRRDPRIDTYIHCIMMCMNVGMNSTFIQWDRLQLLHSQQLLQ